MTVYWNSHADLYGGCTEAEAQIIEVAAKARRLGRFTQARAVLDTLSSTSPVVALERAVLETNLGLQQNRVDVLEAAIQRGSGISASLLILLTLQHSEALSYRHGTVKASLKLARETKVYLEALPLSEWKSTDVGIAIYYFSIIEWVHLWSAWANLEEDMTLRGVHGSMSCRDLQYQLLSLGQLQPAHIMHKNQMGIALDDIKTDRAFLEELTAAATSEPDTICCLDARLAFAHRLFRAGEIDASSKELEEVTGELKFNPWILDSDRPWRELRKQQAQVRCAQSVARIPELFAAAEEAQAEGDPNSELSALNAVEYALNPVNSLNRDEDWHVAVFELRKRLDDLDTCFGNNAAAHYRWFRVDRSRLLSHQDMSDIDHSARLLKSVVEFELSYPEFELPRCQDMLYTSARSAALNLGKTSLAKEFDTKAMNAQKEARAGSIGWLNTKFLHLPWNERTAKFFGLVLDLMKQSLLSHEISSEVVQSMLGLEQADAENMSLQLSQLDAAALFDDFYGEEPTESNVWEAKFMQYKDWLFDYPSDVRRASRHDLLCEFLALRDTQLLVHHSRELTRKQQLVRSISPEVLEEWQVVALQKLVDWSSFELNVRRSLDPEAQGASESNLLIREAMLRTRQTNLSYYARAHANGIVTDALLQENLDWFEAAFHRWPAQFLGWRMGTLSEKVGVMRARYICFGTCSADSPLVELDRMEDIYLQQRQSKSILKGADYLRARTNHFRVGASVIYHSLALGFCFEALGYGKMRESFQTRLKSTQSMPLIYSRDELEAKLVTWAQRKKARNVTESLGTEILIPRKIMALLGSSDAQQLLRKEERLQKDLDTAQGNTDATDTELRLLRKEMAEHKDLSSFMSMRNGQAISHPELLALSAELKDVVVTDFVYLESGVTFLPYEFFAMIYVNGALVDIDVIDKTLNAAGINQWRVTYMDSGTPFLGDGRDHINLLFPLIESTVKHSKPGDTILFCPTTGLTGIPLHAIDVDGQPLIARNKVVYTQSLSIFRLCQTSARLAEQSCKVLVIQALNEADAARPEAANMAFVKRINARKLEHASLDKASFSTEMAQAQLIHFYGHATFNHKQPFKSRLDLKGTESVSVEDLFDIPLQNGAHVSLIGCRSGGLSESKNDDSLGLSTALLFGGAASVLSVLWQIGMRDGHNFQEAFYTELLGQAQKRTNSFHDLAEATQRAVLQMRIDKDGRVRPPWHWAGFILQGCWDRLPLLNTGLESSLESMSLEDQE